MEEISYCFSGECGRCGNIERNMLLKYKLDSIDRQARSCVMKRKYNYRKLVALITMPRICNLFVSENEIIEVFGGHENIIKDLRIFFVKD